MHDKKKKKVLAQGISANRGVRVHARLAAEEEEPL
jgi:hypothetical protein